MTRDDIIARLRAHETELRAAGVQALSVVGSFARGDDEENSDVDVVIRVADQMRRSGFEYFGHLDELNERLEAILGRAVDIITEPINSDRLRRQIEKERIVAF
jgi:uncharacterized protein